ncbi:hypothetical protein [Bowmanella denitrificans]|uniref:hypothetical protein n=1 Tax=Bowmanella denitrificans TaxID=366582 RepID=UPI000C9ADEE3|nr:hypothetical protein [Bowmanella denitrificans]
MWHYYALLNDAGVVYSVQRRTDEYTGPNAVALQSEQTELLGMYYNGTEFVDQQTNSPPTITHYHTAAEAITVDGNAAQGFGNTYYGTAAVVTQFSADLVDEHGAVQTDIDAAALGYPPVLKMPVQKIAGGANGTLVDEVYFDVTLVNGHVTATGTIPSSGSWYLLIDRINLALAAINADWRIERANVVMLV